MTADAAASLPGDCREIAFGARAAGDLEFPRPLRLLLTAGWNLTESIGLPVAAYARSSRVLTYVGGGGQLSVPAHVPVFLLFLLVVPAAAGRLPRR
jgi:hypothetical protein